MVGLCVLVAGCSLVAEREHPSPPIFELFAVEQQPYDRLPAGVLVSALVALDSTRSLGSVGKYEFFVGLGRAGFRYCVVVTDVYGVLAAVQCGGESFGGDIADGVAFRFGSTAASAVPGAVGNFGLGDHLSVGLPGDNASDFAAVVELIGQPPTSADRLPDGVVNDGFLVDGRVRLLGVDGDRRFHLGLTEWPAAPMCLFETKGDRSTTTSRGTCGGRDIVLSRIGSQTAHFSAVGFDGETPEGWHQVSPLLRVKDEALG